MSRLVCGGCFCTFDEDTDDCGCIPEESKRMGVKIELSAGQIDDIVIQEMQYMIASLEKDILDVYKRGKGKVFSLDKKEDIKQLEDHVDAFKRVLKWYKG
jgi:uncharacterized protein (DUF779 family)